MIRTRSQAIGFAEDLCTLSDQFTNNVILEKLVKLETRYPYWRRCRGDGNCYYRALGFAYIEKIIAAGESRFDQTGLVLLLSRLDDTVPLLQTIDFPASDSLSLIQEACQSLKTFYISMIGNKDYDAALVWCMRALIGTYMLEHAKDDFNGIPLELALSALGHETVQSLVKNDVMVWGTEAESLVQTVSPFALSNKLSIRMIQLDSIENTNAEYTLRNDEENANTLELDDEQTEITLLFKPGHYDILYRKEEGAANARQEADPEVQDCREKVNCLLCAEEATSDLPTCGCLTGFCVECRESYVERNIEMYRESEAVPCPMCQAPWRIPGVFD